MCYEFWLHYQLLDNGLEEKEESTKMEDTQRLVTEEIEMLKVVLRLIRRSCAHTQKTTLKAQDFEQNKAHPYDILEFLYHAKSRTVMCNWSGWDLNSKFFFYFFHECLFGWS